MLSLNTLQYHIYRPNRTVQLPYFCTFSFDTIYSVNTTIYILHPRKLKSSPIHPAIVTIPNGRLSLIMLRTFTNISIRQLSQTIQITRSVGEQVELFETLSSHLLITNRTQTHVEDYSWLRSLLGLLSGYVYSTHIGFCENAVSKVQRDSCRTILSS